MRGVLILAAKKGRGKASSNKISRPLLVGDFFSEHATSDPMRFVNIGARRTINTKRTKSPPLEAGRRVNKSRFSSSRRRGETIVNQPAEAIFDILPQFGCTRLGFLHDAICRPVVVQKVEICC